MNRHFRYNPIIALVLLVPYLTLLNWLLFCSRYFTNGEIFLKQTVISLAAGAGLYFLITYFAIVIRSRFPFHYHSWKRGLMLVTTAFLVTASVVTMEFFLYDHFHFLGYRIVMDHYYLALAATFTFNIIGTILNETADAMEKWKNTIIESEQLKKVNLQSQLDGLKEQVNPHFLFNSLNSLSSLISENPQMANNFLNEMSQVYRYLLRANENILTPLTTELKFIRSYYHLLKTRYNDGIEMEINVTDCCLDYCIPPLTLQLLTENAVKHNTISKEQPLKIEIRSAADGFLTVKNNFQPKTLQMPSTRVGLNNIINKYRLLNQPAIQVHQSKNEFSVTVALIKEHEIVQASTS